LRIENCELRIAVKRQESAIKRIEAD